MDQLVHRCRRFTILNSTVDCRGGRSIVSLYVLHKAGWQGKVVVLGLGPLDDRMLASLGAYIRSTMKERQTCFALIASGDMSHRVTPNVPCGYHPHPIQGPARLH